MNRLVAFILLVALVLEPTGARATERVLLMGDSQAFLLQDDLAPLVRRAGHVFSAVPVAGSTVIQWAEPKNSRWDITKQWQLVFQFRPTIILLSLGSNDAYMGCRIIANEPPYLERLVKRLKRTGCRQVIWLTPPQLAKAKGGLECFNRMLQAAHQQVYDGRELEGM